MCLGEDTESTVLYFSNQTYDNSKHETTLGIIIDNKLSFYNYAQFLIFIYIKGLGKWSTEKLLILSRITPYLDSSQESTIFKSTIKL